MLKTNEAKIEKDNVLRLLKNQTSTTDSTINIKKLYEVNKKKPCLNEIIEMIDRKKNQIYNLHSLITHS